MDFKKILLLIFITLLLILVGGCDPGGGSFSTGTADVTLAVDIPGFIQRVSAEKSIQSRYITNDFGTVLFAVVTPNYNGGDYDNRENRSLEPVKSRGFADDPPSEGEWREYSENGLTYGIAYLRVDLPGTTAGTQTVNGRIRNLPLDQELIFMLAFIDASAGPFSDSFTAVLANIDVDPSADIYGRGYLITSLDPSRSVLEISLMPTNAAGSAGNTNLAANAGGAALPGTTAPEAMEIYTCTGNSGSTYGVEIVSGGAFDECLLYIFDSMGRTVNRNPQPGNYGEITMGNDVFPTYPWGDIQESQYFLCIYGNYPAGSVGFDRFIYER